MLSLWSDNTTEETQIFFVGGLGFLWINVGFYSKKERLQELKIFFRSLLRSKKTNSLCLLHL